jgi:hypothetical protein
VREFNGSFAKAARRDAGSLAVNPKTGGTATTTYTFNTGIAGNPITISQIILDYLV